MSFSRSTGALLAILLGGGCDGPLEDAGERIDAQNGNTGGVSSMIAGPAEKAGERRDQVE